MNDPRCELMRATDGGRCLAQSAGAMVVGGRTIPLCEDDRRGLEDQATGVTEPWIAWEPSHVTEAIHDRLQRMSAGYFG